jgi:hypothetical protein
VSAPRPLAGLVRLEAHHAGVEFRPDPVRLADGWAFRFVTDGARARESAALYREIGFEVCTDPVGDRFGPPDCRDCRLVAALDFRAIYTRRADAP